MFDDVLKGEMNQFYNLPHQLQDKIFLFTHKLSFDNVMLDLKKEVNNKCKPTHSVCVRCSDGYEMKPCVPITTSLLEWDGGQYTTFDGDDASPNELICMDCQFDL